MWTEEYEFRGTSKPTVNKLYYLLGSIAYRWHELGAALEFKNNKLEEIKADFETSSRRIIELFDMWIESTVDCKWLMIAKALEKLSEASLAEKILHYTQELERVESISFMKCRKSFCPLKDCCYEDQELKRQYFQTDKLAVAPIINQLDEKIDVEIIECLMLRHTKWYEIGIIMGLSKARLDEIEMNNKSLGSAVMLAKMVDTLIQQFSFECTWRKLIDALLDMNFMTVAKELESLALSKCGFSNTTRIVYHKKYRREDFACEGKFSEQGSNEKEVQKHLMIIRENIGFPVLYVSDEDLLKQLNQFIGIRNPSKTKLKLVTHSMEEIGQLLSKESKGIAERVEELKGDGEVKKKVINKLNKNRRELQIRKSTLEENSSEIAEEIAFLKLSATESTKVKFTELDAKHQKVLQQLQEVCEKINKCIQDIEKAKDDYRAINKELTECRIKLNTCKRQLNACNKFVPDSDTHLSPDFKMAIDEAVKEIESTSTELIEAQSIFDSWSPPDVSDPIIAGKGLESAEVDQLSEFRVFIQLPSERPIEQLPVVKCHLKRLACNSITECKVDAIKCDEYRVQYKPTSRGCHELTVTVDEEEVADSPFPVFVSIHPTQLGKPVKVMATGPESYPAGIAVNSKGQVVVATRNGLLLLDEKGEIIKTFNQRRNSENFLGVAVDTTTDDVYAAVWAKSLFLMKLNSELEYLQECQCHKRQKCWVIGVAVVKDEVMVCDKKKSCVKAYSKELELKREIGQGKLKGISDISADKNGNLYVSNCHENCILVFSNNGSFLQSFTVEKPLGVSVADNHLYVTSENQKMFALLPTTGQRVTCIGENAGTEEGQFDCALSLFVDVDGFVYVSDAGNHRIQVF